MHLKSLLTLLSMLVIVPNSKLQAEPYPSTYSPLASGPTLITNGITPDQTS